MRQGIDLTFVNSIPKPLQAAAYIAAGQSVVGLGFAIYMVVENFLVHSKGSVVSDSPAAGWIGVGTGIFMAVIFGTVLAGAINLLKGRFWGRSPIVMLQILLAPAAWYMIREGWAAFGIAVAITVVAALVTIFNPASTNYAARAYEEKTGLSENEV